MFAEHKPADQAGSSVAAGWPRQWGVSGAKQAAAGRLPRKHLPVGARQGREGRPLRLHNDAAPALSTAAAVHVQLGMLGAHTVLGVAAQDRCLLQPTLQTYSSPAVHTHNASAGLGIRGCCMISSAMIY